ncbi:hypothetical protein GN244_ATG18232 [Phytophthora infestans]|uniref:Uncharacterized protein n=1 Tax=Phytophthora infestans TaxID=4787 RepID=A0A833S7E4_PHYIN|nr:hypothetical protein GN244_ATG18232 [Phytophthora infestans]KAF4148707.1 hypothetical protein GN958_ATG02104 [Phytophthora infestans]
MPARVTTPARLKPCEVSSETARVCSNSRRRSGRRQILIPTSPHVAASDGDNMGDEDDNASCEDDASYAPEITAEEPAKDIDNGTLY